MKYLVTIVVCLGLLASLMFVSGKFDFSKKDDKEDSVTSLTGGVVTGTDANGNPTIAVDPENPEVPGAGDDTNVAVDPENPDVPGEILPGTDEESEELPETDPVDETDDVEEIDPVPVEPGIIEGPGAE